MLRLLSEPQLLLARDVRYLPIFHLLLRLLVLVDELQIKLRHFFLGHSEDATRVVRCPFKLGRIEAGWGHAARNLLQVVVRDHGPR